MKSINAKIAVVGILTSLGIAIFVKQFGPVSTENVFKHYASDRYLKRAPVMAILRHTHYFVTLADTVTNLGVSIAHSQYDDQGSFVNEKDGRLLGRNRPMDWVLAVAYKASPEHMIFPPDLPTGQYDYLITVPHPRETLQDAIRKQFGLIAHTETLSTNVLVLTASNLQSADLMVSHTDEKPQVLASAGHIAVIHSTMSEFANALGGYYINLPIVDETGLPGTYNFDLRWDKKLNGNDRFEAIKGALSDLGFGLSPGQRSIDMIVVEYKDGPSDYTPRSGSDLQGYWKGTRKFLGNGLWPVVLKITEPSPGEYRAQYRNLWYNNNFIMASGVSYNPPNVKIKIGKDWTVFEGEINENKTEIKGIITYIEERQSYPMTVELTDQKEEDAKEAQKDYSYKNNNDLTGHWRAKLDNSEWSLNIARLSEGQLSCTLVPPGWRDGMEQSSLVYSVTNLHLEWAYHRAGTFNGRLINGQLTGTFQSGIKKPVEPIIFERVEN